MFQGDTPQAQFQAFHSVDKSILPSTVSIATTKAAIHVDTQLEPKTQKEIVLWNDILQAFKNVDLSSVSQDCRHDIHNSGSDHEYYSIDHGILYPQIQQQDPVLQPSLTYESTMTVDVASSWNAPTRFSSSSTFSAPPLTTFTTRSTAINNTDETTMTHLSHCGIGRSTTNRQENPAPPIQTMATKVRGEDHKWQRLRSPWSTSALCTSNDMAPQYYARAKTWYLKAVEQRHAFSQYSIGVSTPTANMFLKITYRQWIGSSRTPNKDMLGLSTVSAFSTTAAKYSRGMPRDYKQAMRWLLKAAQQENDVAEFNICLLYNNGQGVPQDYIKTPGQFSKAANQGHDGENWRL
ncbi:hypothetical protein K457DRAFT_1911309 [Linnemannia elongata AG-77]|uniref:HCP-like protein n=1 Tax=Linnemannia elongata AG-77 TaxID=1314771 RepID=A0A197JF29_9FUNG|nr:hypothetical protein K457DRAFT_1911309 [Linnemannia elongata AG-77]